MMYNYSIVIPYREKADLLKVAVESVPDRDDIEIIIDNSPVLLPADQIPRKSKAEVCYYTSEPDRGAGRARNVGLENVHGRFVIFLDADDYFTPQAFDEGFDKYLTDPNDITFFCAESVILSTGKASKRHTFINACVMDYLDNGNDDGIRYRFVNPYCKMYRADFIRENALCFEETIVSNDMMFSIRSGHLATRIAADPIVVYTITEGEKNSSLTKTKSKQNQFVRYTVAIEQYLFMQSIGRRDLRFHLLSFVVHGFMDFGIKEGFRYLKEARKNRVNIFLR
jgi:glycosyltransferase involved in cell wall biosynthesis